MFKHIGTGNKFEFCPKEAAKKPHRKVGFFGGEGGMLSTLVLSVVMYRLDYQPFRLVPVSASSSFRHSPYGLEWRCAMFAQTFR